MGSDLKFSLILISLCAILLFGCTGTSSSSQNQNLNNQNNPQVSPTDASSASNSVSDLIASSVPVKCTLQSDPSQPPLVIYFNGSSMYRAEMIDPTAQGCNDTVFISDGINNYLGCVNGPITTGSSCNYLESSVNSTDGAIPTINPYALVSAESSNVQCVNWTANASAFAPAPGATVCNEQQVSPPS